MNIENAKQITVNQILNKIGLQPTRTTSKDSWYLSPFRNEKTASLHVDHNKNIWFDFGETKGGDSIKLVQCILAHDGKENSVSSALRWLKHMHLERTDYLAPSAKSSTDKKPPVLELKSVQQIKNIALIYYLEQRGISLPIAKAILKQVTFSNSISGKTIYALGLKNEEGGYEIRNSFFKGSLGQKSISFIRGTQPKPSGINLFEGMFDYLSVIAQRKGKMLNNDTIILNSINCLHQIVPYIKDYGYQFGYIWLDNDPAGEKAASKILTIFKAENIMTCPMNKLYHPYKDVNAAHIAKLALS